MQKRGILMKHLEVVAAILEYDGGNSLYGTGPGKI